MSTTYLHNLLFALGFLATATLPPPVMAQSGKRAPAGNTTTTAQGGSSTKTEVTVALNGYCPVCVLDMKKWVKGDPQFSVIQDGKAYLFPGEEQKRMFLKDPNKYTPALGGKCTVCLVEMGKAMAGSVQFAAIHEGRLFLFPGEEQKQMFMKNPAKYSNVDLAAGGNCTVCRVEMNQEVPGKSNFVAFHQGMRYWFPSEDQMKMFVANPAKYEVK